MNRTVLFVDDETEIRNSIKRLLRKEPYEVIFASGADEALKILETGDVHLILTDQKMPGTSGVELLSTVKKRWPEIIRLLISGYIETELLMDAVNKGEIYRFITKPWNAENLKKFISEGLAHYDVLEQNRKMMSEVIQNGGFLSTEGSERGTSVNCSEEFIDELNNGVLVLDDNLDIVKFNSKAEMLLGNDSISAGENISTVLSPEIMNFVNKVFNELDGQAAGIYDINGRDVTLRIRSLRSEDTEKGIIFIHG